MTRKSAAAIALADVTLGYEHHPAVHHLSGHFRPGSLTAVVGPNGGGKSTLLKGLAGALRPLGGSIELSGLVRAEIAYLPQQSEMDRSFPITVLDLVCLGLWRRTGWARAIRGEALALAHRALDSVGLGGFEARSIGSLSGGQMQRALFARVLLQDAPVILLDEPFTAIDTKSTLDLIGVIRRWHGETRTIVCVLHDLELVRAHFPESLLLAREPLAWGATPEVLNAGNLLRARRLCEAWNDEAALCRRREPR